MNVKPGVSLDSGLRMRWAAAGFLLGLFALSATAVRSQGPVPFLGDGAPFTIEADVSEAAMDGSSWGDAAVVWISAGKISGRVWDIDGSVRVPLFRVPPDPPFHDQGLSVALSESGALLVGWIRHHGAHLPAVPQYFFQRFDEGGAEVGQTALGLDELGWSRGGIASASFQANGGVAVVGDAFEGDLRGVLRQRFDASDLPLGSLQRIGDRWPPRINYGVRTAVAPDGAALVAWGSFVSGDSGWEQTRLEGLFFDPSGDPQGEPFVIADPAAGFGVDWHPSGGFLVAWNQPSLPVIATGMPSPFSLRARLVSSESLGPEVVVKEEEDGALYREHPERWDPAVAVDGEGLGLVLWSQETASSGGKLDLFGQAVDSDLTREGPRFFLPRMEHADHLLPLAEATGSRAFFLVWSQRAPDAVEGLLRGWRLRIQEPAAVGPAIRSFWPGD